MDNMAWWVVITEAVTMAIAPNKAIPVRSSLSPGKLPIATPV